MKKHLPCTSSGKSCEYKTARARRHKARRLQFERCEERSLLAANLFLQGTAFIDINGNNKLDYEAGSSDQYKTGATIQLYRGNTLIGQATTGADGRYLFDDVNNLFPGETLTPGTYRLRELPPPQFTTSGVEIRSQLNNAVAVNGGTEIEVTLVDPSSLQVSLDGTAYLNSNLYRRVDFTVFGHNSRDLLGQFQMKADVDGAGPTAPINFFSFCIDSFNDFHGTGAVETYDVLPGAGSTYTTKTVAANFGRIGYLYNHYGSSLITNSNPIPNSIAADVAAGLQIALLELMYDANPSITSGNFVIRGAPLAARTWANTFLNESVGKSEAVTFLNVDGPINNTPVRNGSQGVLISGSYNFANVPAIPAALGDFVWHDVNANGIQENGEPGIPDAVVKLLDAAGNVLDTTTTDANGLYLFSGLTPGDYRVMFVMPTGYPGISPLDAGSDDALDSDANPNHSLITTIVNLSSGEFDNTIDAGFYKLAALGDFVWHDSNVNGVQDAGETGIANVTVKLLDGAGNELDTTTTDANGYYLFDQLTPGDYQVMFVQPAGFNIVSPLDKGLNDALDSDADRANNLMTTTVTLASGEVNLTLDAGFAKAAIELQKLVQVKTEIPEVPGGGEGLTPGFWKQQHHFQHWVGFSPTDSYNDVFGLSAPHNEPSSLTLLGALERGGGKNEALGRHAVAAILNASNTFVDYDLSIASIKAAVQNAYLTGNFEPLKNQLDALNNQGADLTTPQTGTPAMTIMSPLDDADTAPGLSANIGDTIIFRYEVTIAAGATVPLANIVVTDDNATSDIIDDFSPIPVDANSDGFNDGDTNFNNILEVGEKWLYDMSIIAAAFGLFTNIAEATGTPIDSDGGVAGDNVSDDDPGNYQIVAPLSSISGFVWNDCANVGLFDSNESGIAGVTIHLNGIDYLGNAVSLVGTTDATGMYVFENLQPGVYRVSEVQPQGYTDGVEVVGTINDIAIGQILTNDEISNIVLGGGQQGLGYNFGECAIHTSAGSVHSGQAATIGFWHNKNGQALLKSLNGGPNATNLGHWLAANFPNIFGANAGAANNLAGKTNAQIAKFYLDTRFNVVGMKLDAQVMAVAFATYVTNSSLAGTAATKYGFEVASDGLGAATFNVGKSGAAFGVADNSLLTVMQILKKANDRATKSVLWDTDGNGLLSTSEHVLRSLANLVFTGINETGDIK